MMKKFTVLMLGALLFGTISLVGCKKKNSTNNNTNDNTTPSGDNSGGNGGGNSGGNGGGNQNPTGSVTVYLDLGEIGLYEGQKGQDYPEVFVSNGIKITGNPGDALPGKDKITSTSGATFVSWMVYENTGAPVAYSVIPNYDTVLLANWSGGSGTNPGGNTNPGGGGGGQTPTGAHGPDGSSLVSWYLVGEGSLWTTEWSVDAGVQLYSNPGSEDKGCILNITITQGDVFKVTDGSTWFGYDKVDQTDGNGVANLGKTNFEGVDDGHYGKNIRCKTTGAYDIYVNKNGVFWIQGAAA